MMGSLIQSPFIPFARLNIHRPPGHNIAQMVTGFSMEDMQRLTIYQYIGAGHAVALEAYSHIKTHEAGEVFYPSWCE